MIQPPVALRILRGKTRCHPYITDLQTFYAVTTEAIARRLWYEAEGGPRYMTLAARAAAADVNLPLGPYVQAAIDGNAPDEIIVRIDTKEPAPRGVNASGMENISTRIVAAEFALFVETAFEWLRHKKKPIEDWPQASNFARIVRNAIVHGGRINIDNPNSIGGSWRNLHYDYRSKGRAILNTGDLSIGDLIILMLEVEEDLNTLGAPFDLG